MDSLSMCAAHRRRAGSLRALARAVPLTDSATSVVRQEQWYVLGKGEGYRVVVVDDFSCVGHAKVASTFVEDGCGTIQIGVRIDPESIERIPVAKLLLKHLRTEGNVYACPYPKSEPCTSGCPLAAPASASPVSLVPSASWLAY